MALTYTQRKERISELLRSVDREVKAGNYPEALRSVEEVFALDPSNVYARAFSERINELTAVQRIEPDAGALTVAAASEVREITLSDAITDAYRCLLTEVWSDGIVTPFEERRIEEMRSFFRVSPDRHQELEREVRHEAFMSAVKEHALSGSKRFDQWRSQYRISAEEFAAIIPRINSITQSINHHQFILIIDDDDRFLLFSKTLLEKKGYICVTASTVNAALDLLERIFPDIILCDISLNDPVMNGLKFYEQFRSIERFRLVPFIFITGNANDELIRRARSLGADDLIAKPVDRELLLASIEGRLRRINELRLLQSEGNGQ